MQNIQQTIETLRFANFLSPLLQSTYQGIARYAGQSLGLPATLHTGQSLDEFANGQADAGFLCGLLYVRMLQWEECPVELLAAPVLLADRYLERPIYYSDVIVRRDSPYASFDDLQGCIWAYNEATSHSGCNIVCYSLLERHKSPNYFGRNVKSGSHLNSLQMVIDGQADAAAIDSHVLDVVLQRNPGLMAQLRVVAMLGPSAIPPVVVAKRLDVARKDQLRVALAEMHRDPVAVQSLRQGLIQRLAPVTDEHYSDVRHMLASVQAATFSFA